MMTIPLEPTLDDLQPWVARAFEDAYQHRPRERASREDMAYGFLSALVYLRSVSSFKPHAEDNS